MRENTNRGDCEGYERLLDRFAQMLLLSEQRIDKTNAMIENLVDVTESISEKYMTHIDSLAECRTRLLDEVSSLTRQLIAERQRNTALVDHLISLTMTGLASGNAANHISVNHT